MNENAFRDIVEALMKPIAEWQDGDELRLPTGESVTVLSESDSGGEWWSIELPNGAVAAVYAEGTESVSIDVRAGHQGDLLSVYWTSDRAELGRVPLCVCDNDGCNDSSLAFGALNADVWFRPDTALNVLTVLARLPITKNWRRQDDVPPGQPQEPLWLGELDDAGNAVLQRRFYRPTRVEPDEAPAPLYETVATRPLEDLVGS